MSDKIATYRDFWSFYLGEHQRALTRALHMFGTALGIGLLIAAAATGDWRLVVAAIISGYAFAWYSHFAIEKNRPATFLYPLWSLFSDFRMLALWLAGRLGTHLDRHGIS